MSWTSWGVLSAVVGGGPCRVVIWVPLSLRQPRFDSGLGDRFRNLASLVRRADADHRYVDPRRFAHRQRERAPVDRAAAGRLLRLPPVDVLVDDSATRVVHLRDRRGVADVGGDHHGLVARGGDLLLVLAAARATDRLALRRVELAVAAEVARLEERAGIGDRLGPTAGRGRRRGLRGPGFTGRGRLGGRRRAALGAGAPGQEGPAGEERQYDSEEKFGHYLRPAWSGARRKRHTRCPCTSPRPWRVLRRPAGRPA